MPRNLTYFISDLHLGASYIPDPLAHEKRICAWLRSIAPDARAIYLLGDVLDYWYEYREVVPRGFVRFFGTLAELADSGVKIVWLKGNHDIWIFDYLPKELGIKVADGSITECIDGTYFFMEHGDGVGETKGSYRIMYRLFRNSIAQCLFSAIHPRWTVAFAHSWSKSSRSSRKKIARRELYDNDKLVRFANEYSSNHPEIRYFVFGHRHMAVDEKVSSGAHLIIIGDCFELMTYGVWNGTEFRIEHIPVEINHY